MTPEELQDALSERASQVEPSADAYAQLADKIAAAPPAPWWQSPRFLWLAVAGGGLAAIVGLLAFGVFDDPDSGDVVAAPTTPTAAPTATASPTPTTTATVTPEPALTPSPGGPGAAPAEPGPPAGVIWPAAAVLPFGEWDTDPASAAQGFVAALTGFDLPVGAVTMLDPIEPIADVTLQSRDEAGEPFGAATVVRVLGGFDDAGERRWGAAWARSDEIRIDSWDFVGDPIAFEPRGVGRAFEGTISVSLLVAIPVSTGSDDEQSGVVGEWFVMGGGVELEPLSGSVPVDANPGGPGYAVFADRGGPGVAPTSLTIEGIDIPAVASDEAPGCSASGLEAPEADETLPQAVEATRQAIAAAATACDAEGLEALINPAGFSYSFGENGDPIGFWQDLEATGGEPLKFLVGTLSLPWAVDDLGDEPLFVWPDVFVADWADVTDAQKDELRLLYDDGDIAGWESFGGFIGYRVGITESGDWIFFLIGD